MGMCVCKKLNLLTCVGVNQIYRYECVQKIKSSEKNKKKRIKTK